MLYKLSDVDIVSGPHKKPPVAIKQGTKLRYTQDVLGTSYSSTYIVARLPKSQHKFYIEVNSDTAEDIVNV